MTTKNQNRPVNFVVFTAVVLKDGELPETSGKAYSKARAVFYNGKKKEEQTRPNPFFDIKAYAPDVDVTQLVADVANLKSKDKVTVKGRLGYNAWKSTQTGAPKDTLIAYTSSMEKYVKSEDNQPSNFAMLTLCVTKHEGTVDFVTDGRMRGKVNGMLSMGKDGNGEYKPALFVEVFTLSKDGNPTPTITAIQSLQRGDYFTVKGSLLMDEWTDKDGFTRHSYTIWANSIEPFIWNNAEPTREASLEGEPA